MDGLSNSDVALLSDRNNGMFGGDVWHSGFLHFCSLTTEASAPVEMV